MGFRDSWMERKRHRNSPRLDGNIYIYIHIYIYMQKWLSINCILFKRSICLCYVTLPECYLRNSQALLVPSDYSKTPPQKPKGKTPACRRFAVRLGAYDMIGSQEKTCDEYPASFTSHTSSNAMLQDPRSSHSLLASTGEALNFWKLGNTRHLNGHHTKHLNKQLRT